MKEIKKRKTYSAPQLEVIDVDHEISLVMVSIPDSDEGADEIWPEAAAQTNPGAFGPASESSSSEASPFGSGSPDYSK